MPQNYDEAALSVDQSAIQAYSRLSYTMWYALAEFVDNSTQSRDNYKDIISEILKEEGNPLTVNIVHNRQTKEITIEDNSIGMTKDDLKAALKIANPTSDSQGRSKYGMGMKTAACWIGRKWTVTTCEWGSGEEWTAVVDVDEIALNGAKVPMTMRSVSKDDHYTRITISDLHRVIQKRTEETIKTYLGSMYMFDLRPDDQGNIALKMTYNGEEVIPPEENEWDTDMDGNIMRRDLPDLNIDGKKVRGWIGVLRRGGRKFGGFSLFQNKRQIQGFPHAWKPNTIFGGVDNEGANNLVTQRLTGVLELEGFIVSHTKDAILFEGDQEQVLEQFLIKETKEYADYAQSRRSTGRGAKWTKEQVRELVKDLQQEFTSHEIQDSIANANLPPDDTLTKNNQLLLKSLTDEDEVGQFDILPDLKVKISMRETSPYDPYVVFVPGASADVIFIIINGLHPYYQTLEAKDSISECIQQYIFDAIAEFKTSKLTARINPDSVKFIKDALLRAKPQQMMNADVEIRTQAMEDLNSK